MSTQVTFPNGPPASLADDGRLTLWFDIDNTLYSKRAGIDQAMREKIQAYFIKLGLPDEEARRLHERYYKEYGLAIRGLIRHHQIDPLDYDKNCDAALPLEDILKRDPKLRALLQGIDRRKARVWCMTNAFQPHALRVLRILGVIDQIEGVVSCNYAAPNFCCKPESEYFREAVLHSYGVDPSSAAPSPDPSATPSVLSRHFFVDDSALNMRGARSFGLGSCVYFNEDRDRGGGGVANGWEKGWDACIERLDELKGIEGWKDCWTEAA